MNRIVPIVVSLFLTAGISRSGSAWSIYGEGFTRTHMGQLISLIEKFGEASELAADSKVIYLKDGLPITHQGLAEAFDTKLVDARIRFALYSPSNSLLGEGPRLALGWGKFTGDLKNLSNFDQIPSPQNIPRVSFKGFVVPPATGDMSYALKVSASRSRGDFYTAISYGVNSARAWSRPLAKATLRLFARALRQSVTKA